MKPIAPAFHHPPKKIADDTWLIRQLQGEGTPAPMFVYLNSLVIRGEQPAIIDTGTEANRKQWIADVFDLVDPVDVRWVFITHDDHDHTGNLAEVMKACPNATLVTNWFLHERLTCAFDMPLPRSRWLGDGEVVDIGDRTLTAIRPPFYDAPTTRGLFDSKTGVYWASDCFATPVTAPTERIGDLDAGFWREGFAQFQRLLSPWYALVDPERFNAQVDRVADLEPSTITGAHSPVIESAEVPSALRMTREILGLGAPEVPGQADLEAMLAQMHAGGGSAL